jgi:hypothetical protein
MRHGTRRWPGLWGGSAAEPNPRALLDVGRKISRSMLELGKDPWMVTLPDYADRIKADSQRGGV